MKIKFIGHSGFQIDNLLIDPFITGNELCKTKVEDIKCDIICITHDHFDHVGDSVQIAKNNDAVIVALVEICQQLEKHGVKTEMMNLGGTITVKGWKIKLVPAFHSSTSGATPAGFVLRKDNKTIYHAGDTCLSMEMQLLKDEKIDIAILPIGDRFTMDINQAIKAIDFIKPKLAIPMHYNTFPMIKADPFEFRKKASVPVEIFEIGEQKNL